MLHALIKILVLVRKLQDVIWIAIIHVNLCNVIKSSPHHLMPQSIIKIVSIFHFVSIKLPVKIQFVMDKILRIATILEDVSITIIQIPVIKIVWKYRMMKIACLMIFAYI